MLKMSVIIGLIGGGYGAIFGFIVVGSSLGSMGPYSFLDFVSLLLFLVPILSLICSLWLVFIPLSSEGRAMLGFISLVGSITPTFFLILTILRLVFPHRDTPTAL
jgi:hypothetical protein